MYSQEFRQSVLSALDKGVSFRKVATLFGISKSTVQTWKKYPIPKENHAGRPPKIDVQALVSVIYWRNIFLLFGDSGICQNDDK